MNLSSSAPISAELGIVAKIMAEAALKGIPASELAAARACSSRVFESVKIKAVPGGSRGDAGYIGNVLNPGIVGAFVESLRHRSVFAAMLNDGMWKVPSRTRILSASIAASAWIVGEGAPVPLSRFTLDKSVLTESKAAAIIVLSAEAVRETSAESQNFINRLLRNAIADVIDRDALQELQDTGTARELSSGNDVDGMRADLRWLFGSIAPHADQKLFLLMRPETAQSAMLMGAEGCNCVVLPNLGALGGEIFGVPTLLTDAVEENQVVLIDAHGLAGSISDIDLAVSGQADVEMLASALQQDALAPQEAQLVSLWQTNSIGIKAVVTFGLERLRPDCIAVLESVQWGTPAALES